MGKQNQLPIVAFSFVHGYVGRELAKERKHNLNTSRVKEGGSPYNPTDLEPVGKSKRAEQLEIAIKVIQELWDKWDLNETE